MREGWYGKAAKNAAMSKYRPANGVIIRCGCGDIATIHRRSVSLCSKCEAVRKYTLRREAELEERFNALMLAKYA